MNFTDEQITAIRSAGFEINSDTLRALEDFIVKAVEVATAAIQAFIEAVSPGVYSIAEILAQIRESIEDMPPRQRYKAVKRLGIPNYQVLFKRPQVYHCRNNC